MVEVTLRIEKVLDRGTDYRIEAIAEHKKTYHRIEVVAGKPLNPQRVYADLVALVEQAAADGDECFSHHWESREFQIEV